jgi:predicted RNA-binding protein with PIN domain
MHYFIDGYNLLFFHLKPDLTLQKRREELIQILDEKFKLLKVKATVVFDGFNTTEKNPNYLYFQSINVIFTSKNQTADDYILEQLMFIKNSSAITVITADKNFAQKARHLGAHTKTPKAFLLSIAKKPNNLIVKDKQKHSEDTKANIERLLNLFEKRVQENDLDY